MGGFFLFGLAAALDSLRLGWLRTSALETDWLLRIADWEFRPPLYTRLRFLGDLKGAFASTTTLVTYFFTGPGLIVRIPNWSASN